MEGLVTFDPRTISDSLDALMERKPELRERFDAALAKSARGEFDALRDLLLAEMVNAPLIAPLAVEACKRVAWSNAWRGTDSAIKRLRAGEVVPLDELCAIYTNAVYVLNVCHEPETIVPKPALNLYREWWAIVAYVLGRALTPFCERFGFDPTPLLRAGRCASVENSAAAALLVERMRLRSEYDGGESGGDNRHATPSDPTMRDLASAAGISDDTFRRVRTAAGIEVKLKGAAARARRYVPDEVDRLIRAALAGDFLERTSMAAKWARWGSTEAAAKPHASK